MNRTAKKLGLCGRSDSRYADPSLSAQYAPGEGNNELKANRGFRRLGDTDDASPRPAERRRVAPSMVAQLLARSARFDQAKDACGLRGSTESSRAEFFEGGAR